MACDATIPDTRAAYASANAAVEAAVADREAAAQEIALNGAARYGYESLSVSGPGTAI